MIPTPTSIMRWKWSSKTWLGWLRLALCRLMIQLSLVTALSSFSHEVVSLEQERLHWDNEEVCSFCCDMEQLCVSFREKNGLTSWQFCNFRFWYNEPFGRGTRFDREHAPFFPVLLARFFLSRGKHTPVTAFCSLLSPLKSSARLNTERANAVPKTNVLYRKLMNADWFMSSRA